MQIKANPNKIGKNIKQGTYLPYLGQGKKGCFYCLHFMMGELHSTHKCAHPCL